MVSSVDRCGNCGIVRRSHEPSDHPFADWEDPDYEAIPSLARQAANDFIRTCNIRPTPDAVDQLVHVFLPCLRIMCERPWDPNGGTWRASGILGATTDAKKKWERFWYRIWKRGERHDDSGLDLINYIGFVMRSYPDSGWGDWGPPSVPESELSVSYPPGDDGVTARSITPALDHIPARTRGYLAAMAAEAGEAFALGGYQPGPATPPETPEARTRREARIRGEAPGQ